MPLGLNEELRLTNVNGAWAAWVNLGEGWAGDWNEEDPNDQNLLRFDVGVRAHAGGYDEAAIYSYCTRMPATADDALLMRGLRAILREYADAIESGGSAKRAMEWMSWICPDDFREKP